MSEVILQWAHPKWPRRECREREWVSEGRGEISQITLLLPWHKTSALLVSRSFFFFFQISFSSFLSFAHIWPICSQLPSSGPHCQSGISSIPPSLPLSIPPSFIHLVSWFLLHQFFYQWIPLIITPSFFHTLFSFHYSHVSHCPCCCILHNPPTSILAFKASLHITWVASWLLNITIKRKIRWFYFHFSFFYPRTSLFFP